MPDEVIAKFNGIADEIQSRSSERTTIIHGDWYISDDLPESLALKQSDGTYMEFTESDFRNSLNRISETRRTILRFSIVVGQTVVRQSKTDSQ